ncbi:chorismate mutase [Arthrobacter glacialis]|uniref:Chorismate mutase n=1 Tax=Arthrobacter glacialis TaxID=1664 RepID=A0A2S3ZZK4_ARTGL|nr:chorismate mutase [Arthrobacter glacialis]POH58420.1 chorismate mutase [Arthrobacter glacialis]POH74643.1 chorismate mutase [Arthrobacter glacialis]
MTEPIHASANLSVEAFDPGASSLTGAVDPAVMAELLSIRSSIDNFDATLVYLLAERFKATQRVGVLKAKHQLPAGDPNRELAQIQRLRALAESAHLDPAFAEKFLNFIISEVIHHHQAISESHSAVAATGVVPVVSVDGQSFVAAPAEPTKISQPKSDGGTQSQ